MKALQVVKSRSFQQVKVRVPSLASDSVQRIAGIDPCAERCQSAQKLGVDEVHSMRSIEVFHRAWENPGLWNPPDICVEAVGYQMEKLNDCLEMVQNAARCWLLASLTSRFIKLNTKLFSAKCNRS